MVGKYRKRTTKERKKMSGWRSPWYNNDPRVQNEWRIADWQYMTELT